MWIGLLSCLPLSQALAGDIAVSEAWARASAPAQESAAVFLHITSQKDANLVAVSSPASNGGEIHSMVHENGMMKMRAMDALELKAGREVVLDSGSGYHLMLVGLKQPLKAGDTISLALTVQFADKHKEKVSVNATVKPLTESHEHMHHH